MNTASPQYLNHDRRRPENELFRLAIDMRDPFLISDEDLTQLIEDAPTPEARGWLRGIAEGRSLLRAISARPLISELLPTRNK